MPGNSLKFPPDQRGAAFRPLPANDPLKGFTHNPDTGDVTSAAVISYVRGVGGFVWDALGFLDVIDLQQEQLLQKISAQQISINSLQQELTDLKAMLAPIVQIIQSLGVTVPDWRTKDDVENGRPDMVDVLSASQAGLRVTFDVVQDAQFALREIIKMDPPTGTVVTRGTEILITVNDG